MVIRSMVALGVALILIGCEDHGQEADYTSSSAALDELSSMAYSSSALYSSDSQPSSSSTAPSSSSGASSSSLAYTPPSSSSVRAFPNAVAGAIWDKTNGFALASPFATEGYWKTFSSRQDGVDSSYVYPTSDQYDLSVELTDSLALGFSFQPKGPSSWASFGFAWKKTTDLSAQGGLCLAYHTLDTLWTLKITDEQGRSLYYALPTTPGIKTIEDLEHPPVLRIAFEDMKPSDLGTSWQDVVKAGSRISFDVAAGQGDMMLMRVGWYGGCGD